MSLLFERAPVIFCVLYYKKKHTQEYYILIFFESLFYIKKMEWFITKNTGVEYIWF